MKARGIHCTVTACRSVSFQVDITKDSGIMLKLAKSRRVLRITYRTRTQ